MLYAIEIIKPIIIPDIGALEVGDVVLENIVPEGGASPDRRGLYRVLPSDGNMMLYIFAAEAGDLLNPDQICPDLRAVVGRAGPYSLVPSLGHAAPAPPAPFGRRIHRLK
ncbi:MAG: hypothetical protein ACREMZ_15680 [Gemmatimonadales bacterium]